MTDIGKAYVQIIPKAEGISDEISKVLDPATESEGKKGGLKLGRSLVNALSSPEFVSGVKSFFSTALDLGGELQQNLGGTEAVFGNYANVIQSKATDAYKNMGMSASDYMATANKMAALFQGSGVAQAESMTLTTQAMQRAADVASVMGIDTQMAMDSIAGAAKGNFTMMDNLGVAMNATTLEAYALEKGVNFKWNTASNAEKAQLAMQMFMDKTSQYQGNFARESQQTLSGSMNAVKASFQDFMATLAIGGDISGPMSNLVTSATTFLFDNLLPAVGNIFMQLPGAIGTAIDVGLPIIMEKGGQLLSNLVQGITTHLPELMASAATMISNFATGITSHLPTILQQGIALIGAIAKGLIQAIPTLVGAIPQIISNVKTAFTSFDWRGIGGDILRGIANGIKNGVGILVDAAKNAAKKAFDAAKSFLGIGSPSKLFAKGVGRWIPAGIAVGIEKNSGVLTNAMNDLTAMTATGFTARLASNKYSPAAASGGTLGGFQQNLYINSPRELSPSEVARQTRNATKQMVLSMNGV